MTFQIECHERLRRTLISMQSDPASVGSGDLSGLIRHVLLREALLSPEVSPKLRVHRGNGWPSADDWMHSGFDIIQRSADSFYLGIQPTWAPDWLQGSQIHDPLRAAFREDSRQDRRFDRQLQSDPCLIQLLGENFSHYTCPGQQQAVQAAFLVAPGTTLVINLPTGSGKSLSMWGPALAIASEGARAVTVVVVPTVALAIDQERQVHKLVNAGASDYLRQRLPTKLAYHSGLSEADKQQFRARIRDGSQVIVFTSPESIVNSLSLSLYDAAIAGYLKYFAVDEAHLISQWGNEFRPEFQSMAGIRNDLLKSCPGPEFRFRTLLLTATLTQETLATLQILFGESDFEIVSAVQLRSEPEYWISEASTSAEQDVRVLSLIRHAPRPFLLYTTRRDAAERWTRKLQSIGISRVACFHGQTDNATRESILDEWRAGDIDAVVATSAFGLGVDKSNVRAVIHACVPETLDRFYQEVGRGGRDGLACTSLLVFTEDDVATARSLSQERTISVEKGLPRWQAMYRAAMSAGGSETEHLSVDLNSRPPHVLADGTSNIAWNLRTLVLMARSRLIRIASTRPPRIDKLDSESDVAFQFRTSAQLLKYFQSCEVQILEHRHLDEHFWQERVEATRLAGFAADSSGFAMLEDMLRNRRELSCLLAELYAIHTNDFDNAPLPVCGGCHTCRTDGIDRSKCSTPFPDRLRNLRSNIDPRLFEVVGSDSSFYSVAYSRPTGSPRARREWKRDLFKFVCAPLVRLGVLEFCVPDAWCEDREYCDLYRFSPHRFAIHRAAEDFDSRRTQLQVPRVTIFDPDCTSTPVPAPVFLVDRPWHLLIAPEDLPDSQAAGSYFDRAHYMRYDTLMKRLNS